MTDAPGTPEGDRNTPPESESLEQTQARLEQERLNADATTRDAQGPAPADATATHPAAYAASPQPAAPAETPQRSRNVGIVAALAVGALVGGVSGAGVAMWAVSSNSNPLDSASNSPTTITVNDPADATQITAVAAKASPSVVTISVTGDQGGGSGSGVILSADGYILTNNHVVTLDGAVTDPTIRVTTNTGRILEAEIVGTDPIVDLAVIKVQGVDNLQPASFADSGALNVGDVAIAIGSPLGLPGTVTSGVVSALNRSITVASSAIPEQAPDEEETPEEPDGPFDFWFDRPGQEEQPPSSGTISLGVIQTDAAINHGNSGGALLDGDGNVIGINVAIAGSSGNIGVGFAIPSNLAQRVADELIEDGEASHGLLGANVLDVQEDPDQADAVVIGASVVEVTQGGAAESAGIRAGDIVTQFNGIPITGKTDLTAQVRALAAGEDAELTYVRDGDATTVTVTLGQLR